MKCWIDSGTTWPQHSQMSSCHLRKVSICWSMWEPCSRSTWEDGRDSSQFHSNSSLAPLDHSGIVWCLYWIKFKGTERSQVAFWSQATCHILHVLVTLVELNFCPWRPKMSRFRQWEHLKDCSSSPPIWCSWSFCNWHVAEKASCNLQSTFKGCSLCQPLCLTERASFQGSVGIDQSRQCLSATNFLCQHLSLP